ncbi:MAG: hypothetical protein RID53_34815 [Coleofasciculus sp. B1-GNL1-01]|uniref:hypothetical protein n=1 Tax=Coleofasciculus sp. B1-GNL1-01 TaxID=3068484 RepID=UPI0032F658E2
MDTVGDTISPDLEQTSKEGQEGMNLICEITQQALLTGYLTLESENQLRQLLSRNYGTEDLKAFIRLQQAVMEGLVRQESRERFFSRLSPGSCIQEVAIAT